jgi:WD40 repeat protein
MRVYDTATWQLVSEQKPHRHRLAAIAFAPGGQRAVTTSWDGTVVFWELPAWKPVRTLVDHRLPVSTASFSPDGQWLATGDRDSTLHIRDARDGAVLHTLRLPEGAHFMNAFFAAGGRTIVTGTMDGVIRVWHATSGSLLYAIDAVPDGKLFDSALSPDGTTVVTAGLHGADLWRLDAVGGHRIIRGLQHTPAAALAAAYSSDGARIVAPIEAEQYGVSTLHLWDARTGVELRRWDDVGSGNKLAASADLSRIVTGYDPRPARLWDGASGRLIGQLDHGGKWVRGVAITADGALVATAADDTPVRLWRGTSGEPISGPATFDGSASALAFAPGGTELAVGLKDGRLRLLELATLTTVREVKAHATQVEGVEYSADGAWLVTAGRQDHTAKVWNARTGELRATLTGHVHNLTRASFSPDATLVATSSVDNTARIWDARTGEILRIIRGPAQTARFSRDGRELLTTGSGDYLVVWDATLDARGPDAIARLVQQRSPWQLREGRLVLGENQGFR